MSLYGDPVPLSVRNEVDEVSQLEEACGDNPQKDEREREKEVLPVGQDVKDRPQDVTRKKENSLEGQR